METLRVDRPLEKAEASPDSTWRELYRVGGILAILFVVLTFVVPTILGFVVPQPPSAGGVATFAGGVATLQYIASNQTAFILEQSLIMGPSALAIVVFLALYMALKHLNKSYAAIGALIGISSEVLGLVLFFMIGGLVYLSGEYMAATTAVERITFTAAAESLISMYNALIIAGILLTIGILLISLVMLKGVFPKWIAYVGIATGVVGIVSEALRPIIGYGYSFYGVLLVIWFSAIGWKLYTLGRG